MTNLTVIENKISVIQKYLNILKAYQQHTKQELENDNTLKGAVERYLYLAVQASIDLAEAYIAYKNFRKPTTYRESFEILLEKNCIPKELSEKLIKMTGFRNLIAHAYEIVDMSMVYDILHNQLGDIESFIENIKDRC